MIDTNSPSHCGDAEAASEDAARDQLLLRLLKAPLQPRPKRECAATAKLPVVLFRPPAQESAGHLLRRARRH